MSEGGKGGFVEYFPSFGTLRNQKMPVFVLPFWDRVEVITWGDEG